MAKKTPHELAVELVREHLGAEPTCISSRGIWLTWEVVYLGSKRLTWEASRVDGLFSGERPAVHRHGTAYFDTVQAAIRSITSRDAKDETLTEALGKGSLAVRLDWKVGGDFVRRADFIVQREVADPARLGGAATWYGYWCREEAFVLYDPEAVAMAQAFIDGELPGGILLDWLRDRDEKGMSTERPWYNPPGVEQQIVTGRLEALLALPAGERLPGEGT